MLSTLTPDQLVPADHAIREIKSIVDHALNELSPVLGGMYAPDGRPSIPPEHLLKSCLLIALYTIRSERQFCERLQYDLLFKWFLDLNIEDRAFDSSTFSKNKERLLEHDVARRFFIVVKREAQRRRLLSSVHFSVDGTLLEAWALMRSFRPKNEDQDGPRTGGRNPDVDFRNEQRLNDTHQSRTDPEAKLMRKGKGKEARLSFMGHVLIENRNGLVVDIELTQATGTAEREAAVDMLDRVRGKHRITLGADKAYDTADFVSQCREMNVTPHIAQNVYSAIDGRTSRQPGYEVSQRMRKRVEEVFGWKKTVGGGRKLRYRGVRRNRLWAELTATAYNLVRMAKLAQRDAGGLASVPA
ncbi:MAG: IS5 family transposase [Chloroflexi bacterium]|nr:IS5 family transposase [Chloroflexota bacterium]